MVARQKLPAIHIQLIELLNRIPATQKELADRFGITQGHLSKIKTRKIAPSRHLKAQIEKAYFAVQDAPIEPWLENLRHAAETSRDARSAMEAIARIIQKYA